MKKSELRRVDKISVFAERTDDINVSFSFDKSGNIIFEAERLDGIECTFTYTDKPDIGNKYLEVEPELIWVYPDFENYNNVYSNVNWIVN